MRGLAVRRVFFLVISLSLLAGVASARASEKKTVPRIKTYSQKKEEPILNRVGDWFTTLGMSEEKKAKFRADRRVEQKVSRAEEKRGLMKKKIERKKRSANESIAPTDWNAPTKVRLAPK